MCVAGISQAKCRRPLWRNIASTVNITDVGRMITSNAQHASSLITIRVRSRSPWGSCPMADTTVSIRFVLLFVPIDRPGHRRRPYCCSDLTASVKAVAKRTIETLSDSRHPDGHSCPAQLQHLLAQLQLRCPVNAVELFAPYLHFHRSRASAAVRSSKKHHSSDRWISSLPAS